MAARLLDRTRLDAATGCDLDGVWVVAEMAIGSVESTAAVAVMVAGLRSNKGRNGHVDLRILGWILFQLLFAAHAVDLWRISNGPRRHLQPAQGDRLGEFVALLFEPL